jgi:hypothetical protein
LYENNTPGDHLNDLRFYQGQLTVSEIEAIYTNPNGGRSTLISGNSISTGNIQSNNWSTGGTVGSEFNLDSGLFQLGGDGANARFKWDGTDVTVGSSATEHVEISSTAMKLKDGTTTRLELNSGGIYLGPTSTEHIHIYSTGLKIKDGSTTYVTLSSTGLDIGNNIILNTSGDATFNGDVVIGSPTGKRISMTTTNNDLRFYNSSNSEKVRISDDLGTGTDLFSGMLISDGGTTISFDGTNWGNNYPLQTIKHKNVMKGYATGIWPYWAGQNIMVTDQSTDIQFSTPNTWATGRLKSAGLVTDGSSAAIYGLNSYVVASSATQNMFGLGDNVAIGVASLATGGVGGNFSFVGHGDIFNYGDLTTWGDIEVLGGKVTISNDADASLHILADGDNATESHNAYIRLSQDGGAVTGYLGFTGAASKDPEYNAMNYTVDNGLIVGTDTAHDLQFVTNNSAQMIIESNGYVGIGDMSPNYHFDVARLHASNDIVHFENTSTATNADCLRLTLGGTTDGMDSQNFWIKFMNQNGSSWTTNMQGGIRGLGTSTQGVTLWTNSDVRLKYDIKPYEGALDMINSIPVRQFKWRGREEAYANNEIPDDIGWVADELEAIIPVAVSDPTIRNESAGLVEGDSEYEYKTIQQRSFIPIMMKAIQEQQTIIDDLTARIVALENA